MTHALPVQIASVSTLALLLAVAAAAEPPVAPLHERIDTLLDASYIAPPSGPADEATQVRRLFLDLTGRIPSADELRSHLADPGPDKWARLVDSLLSDPRFVQHMADNLDVALMERRADKHVKRPQWRAFIEQAVNSNMPFNELARQILIADGSDVKQRGPAKFYLEREAEPNLLTRDIGRVFFGVDLQCAQCHDHPLIDDYYQADYYGFFAFVSRLSMFADKKKKVSYLSEKFNGETSFKSVFTDESGKTNPRLLWDQPLAADPAFPKGQEYKVAPSKTAAGVPKHSRRQRLAEEVAKGENLAFRRNIANRLWAMVMGRGLVDPVDLHHSGNPASHPELLDMLSAEIAASGFDMRAYLRQIVMTRAYRRDFALPASWPQTTSVAAQRVKWEAEQKAAAEQLATYEKAFAAASTEFTAAAEPKQKAAEALAPLAAEETKRKASLDAAQTALNGAAALEAAALAALQPLTDADSAVEAARAKLDKLAPAELLVAQKTIQAKRAAAAKDHQAKMADAAKKRAAAEAATAAHLQARTAAAPLRQQLAAATTAAAAAEQSYRAAETALEQARARADSWQRKLDQSQILLTAAQQHHAAGQAVAGFNAARQAATPIAAQRDPLVAQVAAAEANAKGLAKLLAESTAKRDALQPQLAATTESVALLGEATQLVARIDPGVRTEVADAVKQIDARRAALASQQQQQSAEMAALTAALAKTTGDRDQAAENAAQLKTKLAALNPQWQPLAAALAAAQQQLTAAEAPLAEAVEAVRRQRSRQFAMTGLQALTPEQLCWSMLEATGQLRIRQAAAAAAMDKKTPLSDADKQNPAKLAQRQQAARVEAETKLASTVTLFVKLFAAAAGQPQGEFFATADQALFFRNGSQIRGWVGAGGDTLYGRLAKLTDDTQLAEDLYVSVLSRLPDDNERNDVAQYLQSRKDDRPAALQEMIWRC